MTTVRQIGVNVLTQWGAFVLRAAIGIFLIPFLITSLGRDYFGIAMLMGVIITFSGIADLGLRAALGRHLSEALAQEDCARFSRLASTAGLFWLGIGFISGLVLFLAAESIVSWLAIPEHLIGDAVYLLRTFGVASLIFAFIQPLFNAVVSCHNRFDLLSWVEAVATVAMGAGLYLFLGLGGKGIFAWAAVTIGARIGAFAASTWLAYRLSPTLILSPRMASYASFRDLFSLGWQLFFLQLTNLISMKADPLILTKFLGPQIISLYHPGLTLTEKVRPLVMVLANQLYPVTTRYNTLGQDAHMEKVLFLGTRITFSLAIGSFVVLGVFSESIAKVWLEGSLGQEYRIAGQVLLGWALVDLFQGAAGSQWAVLIAKNRIKFIVYTQFPLALLNVLASVYLVSNTTLGVVGVIIPTVIIGGFRRALTTLYVKHVFELSAWGYFREAYARPCILLVGLLVVCIPLAGYRPPESSLELIVILGVVAVLWTILFFLISLRLSETRMILSTIVKRRARPRLSYEKSSF